MPLSDALLSVQSSQGAFPVADEQRRNPETLAENLARFAMSGGGLSPSLSPSTPAAPSDAGFTMPMPSYNLNIADGAPTGSVGGGLVGGLLGGFSSGRSLRDLASILSKAPQAITGLLPDQWQAYLPWNWTGAPQQGVENAALYDWTSQVPAGQIAEWQDIGFPMADYSNIGADVPTDIFGSLPLDTPDIPDIPWELLLEGW